MHAAPFSRTTMPLSKRSSPCLLITTEQDHTQQGPRQVNAPGIDPIVSLFISFCSEMANYFVSLYRNGRTEDAFKKMKELLESYPPNALVE